jgi:hypothetical protein
MYFTGVVTNKDRIVLLTSIISFSHFYFKFDKTKVKILNRSSKSVKERLNSFFILSLIVEGTTEKVSQFIMPLMSIYNKMLRLNEQKCIFKHYRKIKPIKIS